jgi:methanogenic corrinoid protein MtbC1
LGSAADSYLEFLANRREAEATRFVRSQHDRGTALHAIYTDIFAEALAEAARRRDRGQLSAAGELFVSQATERIMSIFESELLQTQTLQGTAMCAAFGVQKPELLLRIAAALLAIQGYDVFHLGPSSSIEDFKGVVDQSDPILFILFADDAAGGEMLMLAVEYLRARRTVAPPLLIVGGDELGAHTLRWRRCPADVRVRTALEAVEAATSRGNGLAERA